MLFKVFVGLKYSKYVLDIVVSLWSRVKFCCYKLPNAHWLIYKMEFAIFERTDHINPTI